MIKVTIGITTYNLEKYIEQCLDSILMQKTNFDFKILIVDDASTDNTVKIIQNYKLKFPDKIDLIVREQNAGSLVASNQLFDNIKTEYFSFIDGDDYWIGEDRLQEAIDFLDNNPKYTMYAGNTVYIKNNKFAEKVIKEEYLNKSYTYKDYIFEKCPFVHTSAIILRNIIYKNGIPQIFKDNEHTIYNCAFRGEDIRFIEHLQKGDIYVCDKTLSAYRIHSDGLWQGSSNFKKILEATIANLIYMEMYQENLYKKRFLNLYLRIFNTLINEKNIAYKYQLSQNEHNLLMRLLDELNKKNIDWENLPREKDKKIKKIKYKIMYKIYKYLKKILIKKGII